MAGPGPGYRPSRPENVPPGVQRRPGPPVHRPSRSEEEQRGMRHGANPRGPQNLDIFADPPEPRRHRLRRNSDSSIASKTLVSEEDRKRRERRHKEREARKDGKPRPHGTSSKSKKPNQRLDIIDSLDVTSIYGTGCKIPSFFCPGISILTLCSCQYSIMMDHLTPVTHTEIGRAQRSLQCRPLRRIASTTLLAVQDQ